MISFGQVVQVVKLVMPFVSTAINEVRKAKAEQDSVLSQNTRFKLRLEKERTDLMGKKLIDVVKEGQIDV